MEGVMSEKKSSEIIGELFQGFQHNDMVLYIGTGKWDQLSPEILNRPWRCVVTSRKESTIGSDLGTDISVPVSVNSLEDINRIRFSSKQTAFVELFANQDDVNEEDIDFWEDTQTELAGEKLSALIKKLDVRANLIVINYNPTDSNEISKAKFFNACKKAEGAKITFFIPEAECQDGKLLGQIERARYNSYNCNLSDIFIEYEQQEQENDIGKDRNVDEYLYYHDKVPVTIKKALYLRNFSSFELLTEEGLNRIRPSGKDELRNYYYIFLDRSSQEPQWYGYSPESQFYFKRSYEKALINVVKSLLNSESLYTPDKNFPVILQGDPGSSKSIEMGALAYHIYQEHKNPVIYIKKTDLLSWDIDGTFEELDLMMQEVEDSGNKGGIAKTLLIWDCSGYKNILKDAKDLIRQLENRGRRFVLVCTAYSKSQEEGTNKYFKFNTNRNAIVPSDEDHSDFYSDEEGYYIGASRFLNDYEVTELKKKISVFAGERVDAIERVLEKTEWAQTKDIFEFFYNVISILRPNLAAGLGKEQRLVSQYVQNMLSILHDEGYETEHIGSNTMLDALLASGIEIDQDEANQIQTEEEEGEYRLNKFNLCIALFSYYKLDASYSLAMRILSEKNDSAYDNLKLFKLVTSQIPYLSYGDHGSGDYSFRFRNRIEADIFLRKNAVTGVQKVELVCDLLQYYAENYMEMDETERNSIHKLLRYMGPNSEFLNYASPEERYEHNQVLFHLDKIIEKISEIRKNYSISDRDGGLAHIEVTFIREYYGKNWMNVKCIAKPKAKEDIWDLYPDDINENTYVLRMNKLAEGSYLAQEVIHKLDDLIEVTTDSFETKHFIDQKNSLTVELCTCNTELDSLWDEYVNFCNKKGIDTVKRPIEWIPIIYETQKKMLADAILMDPTNGYAYNALFKLFENEYVKSSSDEQKLKMLAEIRIYADEASSLDLENRGAYGNDEMTNHLIRIEQYASQQVITIDSIENGTASPHFMELFNQMLDRNMASAIYFVCQQELRAVGLYGTNYWTKLKEGDELVLSSEQKLCCSKIIQFMDNPEYDICINNSPAALFMLFQVDWMYYNGRPVNERKEGQYTYISREGWERINSICSRYLSCRNASPRPIVNLIFALSLIQLRKDYIGAWNELSHIKEEIFKTIPRMHVPYIICSEPGVPQIYKAGKISKKGIKNGATMKMEDPSIKMPNSAYIRVFKSSLGNNRMPKDGEYLRFFNLGIGFTSFAVFKKDNY